MEKYLPIKDFPNYEVSSLGNIRNIKTKKILKPQKAKRGGYLRIMLYRNNKGYTITIHRAVALSHLNNPNNYPEVDHKDRNKFNNQLSNLRWITKKDNIQNMVPRTSIIFNQYDQKYIVLFEKNQYEYETIDKAVSKFLEVLKI